MTPEVSHRPVSTAAVTVLLEIIQFLAVAVDTDAYNPDYGTPPYGW